jgi:hypothetical protein
MVSVRQRSAGSSAGTSRPPSKKPDPLEGGGAGYRGPGRGRCVLTASPGSGVRWRGGEPGEGHSTARRTGGIKGATHVVVVVCGGGNVQRVTRSDPHYEQTVGVEDAASVCGIHRCTLSKESGRRMRRVCADKGRDALNAAAGGTHKGPERGARVLRRQ